MLSQASHASASPDLADKVMERIAQEHLEPALGWELRPALAISCLVAMLSVFVWHGPAREAVPVATPQILSFTADKLKVRAHEPITLRWKVLNAQKVLIKDPHGTILEPKQADSITMYLGKPGAYRFVLIALSDSGNVLSELQGIQ